MAHRRRYTVSTLADVALTAGVAKTVIGLRAPAGRQVVLSSFVVSFDGTNAASEGVVVQLLRGDASVPGTSTAATPRQETGPAVDAATLAGKDYTAEPGVLLVIREYLVNPTGFLDREFPLDREPDSALGGHLYLRCASPGPVNVRASLTFEEH